MSAMQLIEKENSALSEPQQLEVYGFAREWHVPEQDASAQPFVEDNVTPPLPAQSYLYSNFLLVRR